MLRYFETGTLVSPEETLGWWTGRCFNSNAPDTPENAMLVGNYQTVGGNEGPLYPPRIVTKLLHLTHSGQGPDYFDSIDRSKQSELRNVIANLLPITTPAQVVSGSLASQYAHGNLEYRIRKNGAYLFEQSIVIRDSDTVKAGSVHVSCYYFSKVLE